jgi:hypothetical protein
VASDASRGRSTSTFVRIHAAELARAARASEAILEQGRAGEAHALARLAAAVSSDLDRLSHSGSDRTQQSRLASQLGRAAARISKLGKRL